MEFDRSTRKRKMANEMQTTDRNGKIPDLQFKESRARATGDCEADRQIGVDDSRESQRNCGKRIGCALIVVI